MAHAAKQQGIDAVANVPDEGASCWERFRQWWPTTYFPICLCIWNWLVSALTVIIYVTNAYYGNSDQKAIIYLAASVSYTVEYLLSMFAAKSMLVFVLWSPHGIDFLASAYGFINFGFYYGDVDIRSFWRLLSMIQLLRLFRVSTYLFGVWLQTYRRPVEVKMYKVSSNLFLFVLGVIFIGGAIFYELVDPDLGGGPQYLHEGFYWSAVTLATIGYGDFYPNTPLTQMLLPVMTVFIVVLLPWKVSDLTTVLYTLNFYMRRRYISTGYGKHVVVVGNFTVDSAKYLIDEFFHPDRGNQPMDMVLLRPKEMNADMMSMLAINRANLKLYYLQGSAFEAEDLSRVDVTKAACVFVVSNKYASDPELEDQNTLMMVLAVCQYLRQFTGVGNVASWTTASWKEQMQRRINGKGNPVACMANVIVQFHLLEYVERAKAIVRRQIMHPPEFGSLPLPRGFLLPICSGTLKHSLVASNIRNPGMSTLISNLTSSVRITLTNRVGHEVDMINNMGWLEEFLRGAETELYIVPFHESYLGMSFKAAAMKIYTNHHAVLIGVGRDSDTGHSVLLAPLHTGIIISSDITTAYVLAKENINLHPWSDDAEDSYADHTRDNEAQVQVDLGTSGSQEHPINVVSPDHVLPILREDTSELQPPTHQGRMNIDRGSRPSRERDSRTGSDRSLRPSLKPGTLHCASVKSMGRPELKDKSKDSVALYESFKRGFVEKPFTIELEEHGLSDMLDPYIIIGSSCFPHLYTLVASVRGGERDNEFGPSTSAFRRTENPVIIMDLKGPTAVQAAVLSVFSHVHYLKGSPILLTDMRKLGLKRGSHVRAIVLPSKESLEGEDYEGMGSNSTYSTDAENIQICSNLLVYCNVCESRLSLTTEVVSPLNAPYLLSLALSDRQAAFAPEKDAATEATKVSGGRGNDGSLAIDMPPQQQQQQQQQPYQYQQQQQQQCGYNEAMQHAGQKIGCTGDLRDFFMVQLDGMFNEDEGDTKEAFLREMLSGMPFLSPTLSSGHVISSGFLDNLLVNSLFNPDLPEIIYSLIGVVADAAVPEGGEETAEMAPRIHSVPLSAILNNCPELKKVPVTYFELFASCLDMALLPIGLYRVDEATAFPYVVTNPPGNITLRPSDSVFLLACFHKLPQ